MELLIRSSLNNKNLSIIDCICEFCTHRNGVRNDIGIDKTFLQKNFFLGLVEIVHTAGVLLLHHLVDKEIINYRHLKTRVYALGSLIYPGILQYTQIDTAYAVAHCV